MATPLPPPFIQIENVHNIRALLSNPSSSTILYRSGSISQITHTGLSTLHSQGVRAIYDLRSNQELRNSDPLWLARRFRHYASANGTAGFVKAYTDILEAGAPAFGRIFTYLRDATSGEKCLVHCSAGKDRTGVFCALVLMLAGCTDEEVADEYALTEIGLADQQRELVARLMKVDALKGDREGVERMVGARKGNMLAVIEVIRERYGGVEGYMRRKCGLNEEDIMTIKTKITMK